MPEAVSRWIYDEALTRKISPSLLTSELLAEAIAARQQRRVLTPDDLLAAVRAYADYMQQQPEIAERLAQLANLPRAA